MDVIVGTAGHIDHGKTALVKALTGVDADRLPEEKQRGITIDLGFAEMQTGDVRIGFVDVPGHERFVKNMLAGASGIDLVLLVVAADEGVMPQTREHFDICRLLNIPAGVIVLTKADLADAETLELARLDVAELVAGSFLEGAPVFVVSARTGEGITELKAGLTDAAGAIQRGTDMHEARLAIDRSFSVKGFGAVVTGTLTSGEISEGDELDLLPTGRRLRVRGIQTHGKETATARAGQRTAINLAAVDHAELHRGMVLASSRALTATLVLDAEIEMLGDAARPLRSRQRVRVHIGTSEALARVAILNEQQAIEPGAADYVQLRFETPVVAALGDRFILRSYSPQHTVGGGRVLDPAAHKHRRRENSSVSLMLRDLADAANDGGNVVEVYVRMAGEKGITLAELRERTALRTDSLKRSASTGGIFDAGGVLIKSESFESLQAAVLTALERHHRADKLSRGMPRETLREQMIRRTRSEVFRAVIEALQQAGNIVLDQDVIKLASHSTELSAAETKVHAALSTIYADCGLEVPKLDDALQHAAAGSGLDNKAVRKLLQLLLDKREIVAVSPEFYFGAGPIDELVAKLRDAAQTSGDATLDVARFKELAGVSRKYAIPLLEYFDRPRVTMRVGDKRKIL
ncbi:MAG TPA: selenocysteine-specific translation elongation factor [Pyrinomonadaceae bacterium]|nr:selenocysteine-specific translation elongation factor [Pyrinomonadaceae bacterium]